MSHDNIQEMEDHTHLCRGFLHEESPAYEVFSHMFPY